MAIGPTYMAQGGSASSVQPSVQGFGASPPRSLGGSLKAMAGLQTTMAPPMQASSVQAPTTTLTAAPAAPMQEVVKTVEKRQVEYHTVIREQPQIEMVERQVEVPTVEVREKIEEVPQVLIQE